MQLFIGKTSAYSSKVMDGFGLLYSTTIGLLILCNQGKSSKFISLFYHQSSLGFPPFYQNTFWQNTFIQD